MGTLFSSSISITFLMYRRRSSECATHFPCTSVEALTMLCSRKENRRSDVQRTRLRQTYADRNCLDHTSQRQLAARHRPTSAR
jgi:hypothetical protein